MCERVQLVHVDGVDLSVERVRNCSGVDGLDSRARMCRGMGRDVPLKKDDCGLSARFGESPPGASNRPAWISLR